MNNNKPPPRQYRTDLVRFSFRSNQRLAKEIEDLTAERHTTLSDTLRMLIDMGLGTYKNNAVEGNTTSAKAQQAAALRRAQAEAQAARKSLRKQGDNKNVTAVTPMLFGVSPDHDE